MLAWIMAHSFGVMVGALVVVIAGVVAVTLHREYQDRLAAAQLGRHYAELRRIRREVAKLRGIHDDVDGA